MGSGWMDVQFAELAPEGEMLLRRDVLVAKEDHQVFGQRPMDLVHLAVWARIVRDELAEIDAGNLRADDRGELLDLKRLVRLLLARGMAIARTLLAGERAHVSSKNCRSHRSAGGSWRNQGCVENWVRSAKL